MRKTNCIIAHHSWCVCQETVQCTALARLAYAASSPERSRTATMKKTEKTHPHRSSTDWRDPDWPEGPGWRDKRSTRDRRERPDHFEIPHRRPARLENVQAHLPRYEVDVWVENWRCEVGLRRMHGVILRKLQPHVENALVVGGVVRSLNRAVPVQKR